MSKVASEVGRARRGACDRLEARGRWCVCEFCEGRGERRGAECDHERERVWVGRGGAR
jgi:hypothetical protein